MNYIMKALQVVTNEFIQCINPGIMAITDQTITILTTYKAISYDLLYRVIRMNSYMI